MNNPPTPSKLAPFEPWQTARLSPQQKSDMAAQLIEAGHDRASVEAAFGPRDFKLSPTESMVARKVQAAYLRRHWNGDRGDLELALAKAGLK